MLFYIISYNFLKKKDLLSSFLSLLKIARLWGNEISPSAGALGLKSDGKCPESEPFRKECFLVGTYISNLPRRDALTSEDAFSVIILLTLKRYDDVKVTSSVYFLKNHLEK